MNTNTGKPTKADTIQVNQSDLPLSCPRPEDEVWNMHPRVYLPIEKTGEAICPYCGARYRLAD
ncbi:MAG: zinc-finger domain-containing protein [Sedimenticolaceae bacterium]